MGGRDCIHTPATAHPGEVTIEGENGVSFSEAATSAVVLLFFALHGAVIFRAEGESLNTIRRPQFLPAGIPFGWPRPLSVALPGGADAAWGGLDWGGVHFMMTGSRVW